MKSVLRTLLLLFLALAFTLPAGSSFAQADRREVEGEEDEDLLDRARREKRNPLQLYYKASRKGKLNKEGAVRLGKVDLDLPYAKATLDGGWLIPVVAKDIDDDDLEGKEVPERKSIAAVYVGTGSFHWDAPNPTERWMLNEGLRMVHPTKKKVDVDGVDATIERGAVLYFNGSWRDTFSGESDASGIDKKSWKSAEKMWKARKGVFFSSVSRAQTRDAFAEGARPPDSRHGHEVH